MTTTTKQILIILAILLPLIYGGVVWDRQRQAAAAVAKAELDAKHEATMRRINDISEIRAAIRREKEAAAGR